MDSFHLSPSKGNRYMRLFTPVFFPQLYHQSSPRNLRRATTTQSPRTSSNKWPSTTRSSSTPCKPIGLKHTLTNTFHFEICSLTASVSVTSHLSNTFQLMSWWSGYHMVMILPCLLTKQTYRTLCLFAFSTKSDISCLKIFTLKTKDCVFLVKYSIHKVFHFMMKVTLVCQTVASCCP